MRGEDLCTEERCAKIQSGRGRAPPRRSTVGEGVEALFPKARSEGGPRPHPGGAQGQWLNGGCTRWGTGGTEDSSQSPYQGEGGQWGRGAGI